MKYLLLLITLFTLTAEENLPSINQKLVNGHFKFTGKVMTNMGSHNFVHNFKGQTTNNTFYCSWVQDMGHIKMKGSVSTNGDRGVMKMDSVKDQKSSAELAIASSTGVSGGSAHLMYALWKGDTSSIFPDENLQIFKRDGLTIIKGDRRQMALTITMKDSSIISIESIFDPMKHKKLNSPEITDDEIKEMLKATNKKVTEKSINEAKEMLKKANESLSTLKDKVKTKTVFTIR
jgi:hypothetical protein